MARVQIFSRVLVRKGTMIAEIAHLRIKQVAIGMSGNCALTVDASIFQALDGTAQQLGPVSHPGLRMHVLYVYNSACMQ